MNWRAHASTPRIIPENLLNADIRKWLDAAEYGGVMGVMNWRAHASTLRIIPENLLTLVAKGNFIVI
jgi:hypothetical protein